MKDEREARAWQEKKKETKLYNPVFVLSRVAADVAVVLAVAAAVADCHRCRFCLICCFAVVLVFNMLSMHMKQLEQNP